MTEIKEKKDGELKKLLVEKRQALREFRFGKAGSKTRDVHLGARTRKEIARILTEIKLRDL